MSGTDVTYMPGQKVRLLYALPKNEVGTVMGALYGKRGVWIVANAEGNMLTLDQDEIAPLDEGSR